MSERITLEAIAYVHNERKEAVDDNWANIISEMELIKELPESCFDHIDDFSHLEIIYFFNKSSKTVRQSERPRENPAWPKAGIFAQRKIDEELLVNCFV